MKNKRYPHIIKNIREWPIYKAAKEKNEFKERMKDKAFEIIVEKNKGQLKEVLAQCAYSEKKRVDNFPFKVDPPSEKSFWNNVRAQLTKGSDCSSEEECEILLRRVISRYVEEIVGDFKLETFLFAEKALTYFFNRLYSSWFAGSLLNIFNKRKILQKKLILAGYVEHARKLFDKGTVVLVPTHQSNLDSVLVGYFMQLMAGMPAFSYGAGLNLYNFEIFGYYMDRLGAYKVDRRKRNSIYHETLFTFLRLSVQDGVNNLFFPAGGRVRDGKMEQKLKQGLLSALVQAEKSNSIHGLDQKIFIVPVVMNNHFVLEAKSLINQYLAKRGKERYNRSSSNVLTKYISFFPMLYQLISRSSEVVLSFGKPMDVLGNQVDEQGQSIGANGHLVELGDYFKTDGEFKPDFQRESIYTRKLADSIARSYLDHAVVLSSQLMAFITYNYLKKQHGSDDIFDLMSIEKQALSVRMEELLPLVVKLRDHIIQNAEDKALFIHEDLFLPPEQLVITGIKKLGTFHVKKALKINSDQKIICKDLKLLYYYANRLSEFNYKEVLFG
jgi:glycerol-3-phosphate O-acyltransferase